MASIIEANGNSYWVRYNANPNNLNIGDCGFRAISKAFDIPYQDVLKIANAQGFATYKSDRYGNSTYAGAYGSFPMLMCMSTELKPFVEDILDFSSLDLPLIDFTARVSRSKKLKDKTMLVEVADFNSDRDSNAGGKKIKDKDKFQKLIQKVKDTYLLKNVKDDARHIVAVKDGKYYDTWDSGKWLVRTVAIISTYINNIKISQQSLQNDKTTLDKSSINALDKIATRLSLYKSAEKAKADSIKVEYGTYPNKKLQKSKLRIPDEFDMMFISEILNNFGVKSSKQCKNVIFLYNGHPCNIDDSHVVHNWESDDGKFHYETGQYGDECFMWERDINIDDLLNTKDNMHTLEIVKKHDNGIKLSDVERKIYSKSTSCLLYLSTLGSSAPFLTKDFISVNKINLELQNGHIVNCTISGLNNKYTYRMTNKFKQQYFVFDIEQI